MSVNSSAKKIAFKITGIIVWQSFTSLSHHGLVDSDSFSFDNSVIGKNRDLSKKNANTEKRKIKYKVILIIHNFILIWSLNNTSTNFFKIVTRDPTTNLTKHASIIFED